MDTKTVVAVMLAVMVFLAGVPVAVAEDAQCAGLGVIALYYKWYGRAPDARELNRYAIPIIRDGVSLEQTDVEIAAQRIGESVITTFRNIVHRPPTVDEFTAFASLILTGQLSWSDAVVRITALAPTLPSPTSPSFPSSTPPPSSPPPALVPPTIVAPGSQPAGAPAPSVVPGPTSPTDALLLLRVIEITPPPGFFLVTTLSDHEARVVDTQGRFFLFDTLTGTLRPTS